MDILVVEDEIQLADTLKQSFEAEGYRVDVALDGEAAEEKARKSRYSLIVMNLALPKKDGLAVIKELRKEKNPTPILSLSVEYRVADVIAGLNAGSDAYLKKPFDFAELVARARALVRREELNRNAILRFADIQIDTILRKAWRGERELDLTAKEYALLEYFMRNPNRILSREVIAENVWRYAYESLTNIIDVYINYLRKKVDTPSAKKTIHTVRGIGYVLKNPVESKR